jgi:hypothetical protein
MRHTIKGDLIEPDNVDHQSAALGQVAGGLQVESGIVQRGESELSGKEQPRQNCRGKQSEDYAPPGHVRRSTR